MDWPRYQLDDDTASAIAAIAATLAESEAIAERDRHLPDLAVHAMRDAGLFAVALPTEVGGQESGPLAEMEVYENVARISTAAAWNLFVGNFHTSLPAAYAGDNAIEAMFGDGRGAIVAGQPAPFCVGQPATGGIRVSGRHSWGSGINHANWVLAGCRMEGSVEGPPMRVVVVPKREVTLIDNWRVAGLSGTGSCDYLLDDVFVPDGFWWDFSVPIQRRGGGRYAVPVGAQSIACHTGLALGAGERAIGLIASLAATKRRRAASTTVADRGAFQRDLGKAYTELAAARDYAAARLDELGRRQQANADLPAGMTERLRAMATHATDVALAVANLAFRYAGGAAAFLDSPIQRVLRDLTVAQQHIVVADVSYDELGVQLVRAESPDLQPELAAAPTVGIPGGGRPARRS